MRKQGKLIKIVVTCLMGLILLTVLATSSSVATPKYKFILASYCGAGNPFWSIVEDGMRDAAKALGVEAVMQYAGEDTGKQIDFIDVAIAGGVDGIGVVIHDSTAFDAPVQRARDAGIPVVAFNIDDEEGALGNARQAFIGQTFKVAGYKIGKIMAELLPAGCSVVCPVEWPGAVYAVERYAGVKEALDEKGIKSEMLDTGAVSLSDTLTRIESYLIGHPEVKAVIGLGGMPTAMAPKAVEEVGLKDVLTGGFDINSHIIRNVKEGKTVATVDQQAYLQGFYAVVQLYLANMGLVPLDMDTGSAVIDKTNVDLVDPRLVP